MAPEFKEKQQEVSPSPLPSSRTNSHARPRITFAQITKHYLPLERDPLIAPEQREVRLVLPARQQHLVQR